MPQSFLSHFQMPKPAPRWVTVVSGLPRSGTSMMMQILQAGGVQILTDQVRTADDDNPKGYYEFERAKKLREGDMEWVKDAQGKAVKIISALLEFLPPQYKYKVIFMQRNMDEILASQKQMLVRRNEPTDKVDDATLAGIFRKHLDSVQTWLASQPNIEVLYVNYGELIKDPAPHIQSLARFLDIPLDVPAMLAAPDKSLHRQKK